MMPSDTYIDECMKILKRFLKENGIYTYMMHYLFGHGRGLNSFYKSVKYIYDAYNMDFGDILHMIQTLGPGCKKVDWKTHIRPISEKFEKYFYLHKNEIKVPFFEYEESNN